MHALGVNKAEDSNIRVRTPCAPDRLMIGASRLLVRLTVRMRACCLSSLEEEMAIWVSGAGEPERARFMSTPLGGGDAPRFDMVEYMCWGRWGGGDGERERGRGERALRTRRRDATASAFQLRTKISLHVEPVNMVWRAQRWLNIRRCVCHQFRFEYHGSQC